MNEKSYICIRDLKDEKIKVGHSFDFNDGHGEQILIGVQELPYGLWVATKQGQCLFKFYDDSTMRPSEVIDQFRVIEKLSDLEALLADAERKIERSKAICSEIRKSFFTLKKQAK